MCQKDMMHQDMFLIGEPSLNKRRLVMAFGEMTNRNVRVVPISSDTTESDLKQRRELVGDSAIYYNQGPVQAAIDGEILLLDNVQNASRNILPLLNNLLENREMNLEDNSLLIHHARYKSLLERGEDVSRMIPTHEGFRVIATGVPVPPYEGNTLDPPLRSRFQSRRLSPLPPSALYSSLVSEGCDETIASGVSRDYGGVLEMSELGEGERGNINKRNRRFGISSEGAGHAARYRAAFGTAYGMEGAAFFLGARVGVGSLGEGMKRTREALGVVEEGNEGKGWTAVISKNGECSVDIAFSGDGSSETNKTSLLNIPSGSNTAQTPTTISNNPNLLRLLKHSSVSPDRPILLLGGRGSGKSFLAREFGAAMGYGGVGGEIVKGKGVVVVSLYKDMSSRDLVLRRRILDDSEVDASAAGGQKGGDTTWELSPLLQSALDGHLCILDGIEKISPDSLLTIQGLLADKEIHLPNGDKFLRADRWDLLYGEGGEHPVDPTVHRIHPAFRVVAIGTISDQGKASSSKFISEDVANTFTQVHIPQTSDWAVREIIEGQFGGDVGFGVDKWLDKVLKFRSLLSGEELSLRNIVRIGRKLSAVGGADGTNNINNRNGDVILVGAVMSVLNGGLMNESDRKVLLRQLVDSGIDEKAVEEWSNSGGSFAEMEHVTTVEDLNIPADIDPPKNPQLVPKPKKFFPIPHHLRAMKALKDDLWSAEGGGSCPTTATAGENAVLILGDQGVGKNVIVDRLLEMMQKEREYIQLHRDSTVGQLTLTPNLVGGRIVWEDSPLVRAGREGRVLVIDEADKAPLDVVAVLKGLVEDGEIRLADGRRMVRDAGSTSGGRGNDEENVIPIHPDFKIIVLANRPGYPFLGNDFFSSIGDIFSTHILTNPPLESEIELLMGYAEGVDEKTVRSIAESFRELRNLVKLGEIKYPYSTREAVATVRHLAEYPGEGVQGSLMNILDFDAFDPTLMGKLHEVFGRNGIQLPEVRGMVRGELLWEGRRGEGGKDGKGGRGEGLNLEYKNRDGTEGKRLVFFLSSSSSLLLLLLPTPRMVMRTAILTANLI